MCVSSVPPNTWIFPRMKTFLKASAPRDQSLVIPSLPGPPSDNKGPDKCHLRLSLPAHNDYHFTWGENPDNAVKFCARELTGVCSTLVASQLVASQQGNAGPSPKNGVLCHVSVSALCLAGPCLALGLRQRCNGQRGQCDPTPGSGEMGQNFPFSAGLCAALLLT